MLFNQIHRQKDIGSICAHYEMLLFSCSVPTPREKEDLPLCTQLAGVVARLVNAAHSKKELEPGKDVPQDIPQGQMPSLSQRSGALERGQTKSLHSPCTAREPRGCCSLLLPPAARTGRGWQPKGAGSSPLPLLGRSRFVSVPQKLLLLELGKHLPLTSLHLLST